MFFKDEVWHYTALGNARRCVTVLVRLGSASGERYPGSRKNRVTSPPQPHHLQHRFHQHFAIVIASLMY